MRKIRYKLESLTLYPREVRLTLLGIQRKELETANIYA